MSAEILPQAGGIRYPLLSTLARYHPALAWSTLQQNVDAVTTPYGSFGPELFAKYTPQIFRRGAPLDQIQAYVKAHVPPEIDAVLARSMETARFDQASSQRLLASADAYIAALPPATKS